jgi:hypothetical protein
MTNKKSMNRRIELAQRPQPSATLKDANFGKLVISLDDALGVTA